MTKIRKLWALTRAGIIESLQFRLGTAVMLFGNLIYLALVYFLWKAIYESSGTDTVNGMTFYDTMIYLILATAIFNLLEMFIVWDMSRAIQSGEIIMHLLKPMPYRLYTFWSYSGAHVNNFFLAFLPTFIAVSLITKGAIPLGINLLWFMVSLILALIVNFNIEMLVAPICLYTESTWGINIVKETVVLLLSGATIPLAFFPEGLRQAVEYLPFRAVYDIPLTVLLCKNGTDTFAGLLPKLGIQLLWCVVLSVCGNLFWNHAVKKITVNGG
jgi:ABC-2 type transport system permease protein